MANSLKNTNLLISGCICFQMTIGDLPKHKKLSFWPETLAWTIYAVLKTDIMMNRVGTNLKPSYMISKSVQ